MDSSLDELRGVSKGWAHGAATLGAKFQNFNLIKFYLTLFSCFQNKVAEIQAENIFGVPDYLMKIMGTPLDELAPTGKICGAALTWPNVDLDFC